MQVPGLRWVVLSFIVVSLTSNMFAAEVKVPASAKEVLTENNFWRWNMYLQKPTISVEEQKVAGQNDAVAPLSLKGRQLIAPYHSVDQFNGPEPPAGWAAFDYNDSDWPKSKLTEITDTAFGKFSTMSVRLRSKFFVKDPRQVKGLYLNLKY